MQAGEDCEAVWGAALGALLHCAAHGGQWVWAWAHATPLAGLKGLLQACLAFRWCAAWAHGRMGLHGHIGCNVTIAAQIARGLVTSMRCSRDTSL